MMMSTLIIGAAVIGSRATDPTLGGSRAADPPSIVIIVVDDLGWNDVSLHGSTQIPTPNIDRLATSGVALNNYYVQPVCSPTRSSLLTGRHVIHTGIYDPDCSPGTTLAVPTNFTMIPESLKELGYATHAVGKWHLGMFAPQVVPTGRGFDTFFGYYGGAEDYFTHENSGQGIKGSFLDLHDDVGANLSVAIGYDGSYSTLLYTERAVRIIEQHAAAAATAQPLFLYLAYQAIHSPDQVPMRYEGRFNTSIPDTPDKHNIGAHRRKVAGMVACLDEGIGNVTQALDVAGMTDSTIVVLSTDNGGPAEGFNNNMASNWPLRGMKRTLWEGGVRGVGLVSGAGIRNTGRISNALLHVTDLPISLLSLAANGLGVDPLGASWVPWPSHPLNPASQLLHDHGVLLHGGRSRSNEPPMQLGDGIDNWAAIATGAPSARSEVLIEAHNPYWPPTNIEDGNGQAIIVGEWKLIYEKGPQWHGPPNDLWYESGSNPAQYHHTVQCGGPPPNASAPDYCKTLPCLFHLVSDPCEYRDLSKSKPAKRKELKARLEVYQQSAVPKTFHDLTGVNCTSPDPAKHPSWQGAWMPFCEGVGVFEFVAA